MAVLTINTKYTMVHKKQQFTFLTVTQISFEHSLLYFLTQQNIS